MSTRRQRLLGGQSIRYLPSDSEIREHPYKNSVRILGIVQRPPPFERRAGPARAWNHRPSKLFFGFPEDCQ
jgi:hypothetical protein